MLYNRFMASEVTQNQFLYRIGYNPSHFIKCGGTCPVENVNWHEAAMFANAMSKIYGLQKCYACQGALKAVICQIAAPFASGTKSIYDCPGFRLPTEAEFEFAARATTNTSLYNGDLKNCTGSDPLAEKIAWYKADSGAKTHWAGSRRWNNWNIFDTSGNVAEWIQDWYEKDLGTQVNIDPWGPAVGAAKMLRGGSFISEPKDVRCAARAMDQAAQRIGQRRRGDAREEYHVPVGGGPARGLRVRGPGGRRRHQGGRGRHGEERGD